MVAIMWLTGGKSLRRPRNRPRPCAVKCRSKSTKPKSPNCKTGSRNCSANNWSRRTRLRSRHVCSESHAGPAQDQRQAAPSNRPNSERGPIQAERKSGLTFAVCFNVALTYRKTPPAAPTPEPATPPAGPASSRRARRPSSRTAVERNAAAPDFTRAGHSTSRAKRFRGIKPRSKGGTEKPCRRAGWLRQRGGRKDLRTI